MNDQQFISLDAFEELAKMFMAYVVANQNFTVAQLIDDEIAAQENSKRLFELEQSLAVIVEEITNARASEQ